jgi:thiosulfate/3-mercaptopyruvate sulfurtransferase
MLISSMFTPIIQPEDLLKLNIEDFILIDASAGSKARYDENHLLGALYVDLNTDLADIKDFASGGRHPLPTTEAFGILLGNLGIGEASHVVVYDDKNGSNAAARFWWMLKAIGHRKVQVLNGGFEAGIKAGFPTNSDKPQAISQKPYPVNGWNLPLASISEVEEASKTGEQTIVDVRDATRFAGLTEPIDLIAGHIPAAINIPFTENLDAEGYFLAPDILKEKYNKALTNIDAAHTIVHCGSGVTACHMLLAMDYAGLPIPKLYIGSWSEWSRNDKEMVLRNG